MKQITNRLNKLEAATRPGDILTGVRLSWGADVVKIVETGETMTVEEWEQIPGESIEINLSWGDEE